ncbi:hypothetical protein BS630_27145 [Rhizobium laguerreae]|nr:hypothetical protein BS630_27145 [Rhizobium laguerreae]
MQMPRSGVPGRPVARLAVQFGQPSLDLSARHELRSLELLEVFDLRELLRPSAAFVYEMKGERNWTGVDVALME